MIIADDHGGATNVKFSDLCSPKAGHAPMHSRNAVRPPPIHVLNSQEPPPPLQLGRQGQKDTSVFLRGWVAAQDLGWGLCVERVVSEAGGP